MTHSPMLFTAHDYSYSAFMVWSVSMLCAVNSQNHNICIVGC